jgi:hypothetical protein
VDAERRASFDQVMSAISHGVEISRDALYDRYGLPRPRDEDDAFTRPEPAGFALSDSESKKKVPIQKHRPEIRIM